MSVVDRHGRRAEPRPCGRIVLTDVDVKTVRRDLMIRLNAMGYSYGVVARVLKCSRSHVCNVVTGRRSSGAET